MFKTKRSDRCIERYMRFGSDSNSKCFWMILWKNNTDAVCMLHVGMDINFMLGIQATFNASRPNKTTAWHSSTRLVIAH